MTPFVPPRPDQWQGPAQQQSGEFVPPPVSSWQGKAGTGINKPGTPPPSMGEFMSGVADVANPIPAIQQIGEQGLQKTLENAAEAQATEGKKARASFSKGRVLEGLGHGAAGILPLVGPAAANVADTLGGRPEMPPNQRTEFDPPDSTQTTEPQPARGLGQATALVAPLAVGAAGGIASRAGGPLTGPLQESAVRSYSRALGPTTKGNKYLTDNQVAPGLIERGTVAATRKGLSKKAGGMVESFGQQIDDAWGALPPDAKVPISPILNAAEKESDSKLTVTNNQSGEVVPLGPQATQGLGIAKALTKTLQSAAETDPATGELVVSVGNLRKIRQYFDRIKAEAGGYEGKNLADASSAEAHGMFADAIREEFANQYPDIAKLNKEFNFWKNTQKVVDDTLLRTKSQATPISEQIVMSGAGGAAAHVGGGLSGAFLSATGAKYLLKFMRSPAWQTTSAVAKSRLADLLASGDAPAIEQTLTSLTAAPGAIRLDQPPARGPMPLKRLDQ